MKKATAIYTTLIAIFMILSVCYMNAYAKETLLLQSVDDLKEKMEETIQPEVIQVETYVETEFIIEPIETKEYRYIDCPLSKEIQQGIFDICESYNVSFEFVMAVIAQESSFRPNALGDNCESKGLMQIQAKWHSDLMEELGVTDLSDPICNVKVGVALLHSYFEESEDVYYVLMKYNGGASYANRMMKAGKVSNYAMEITERAMMYEMENGI